MRHFLRTDQEVLNFSNETVTDSQQNDLKRQAYDRFRPIHYLGSKLRIVELITDIIDEVDPSGGPVCDLFAGSGTVSRELSTSRSVVSVDIQEYSRVLCSALLNPAKVAKDSVRRFLNEAFSSEHARLLSWAIEPMAIHELNCRSQADIGNFEPLCQFLEKASIILYQPTSDSSLNRALCSALSDTVSRLLDVGLLNTPDSITTRYFGGIYFSYIQASQLDMLLHAVTTLPQSEVDTILAAILSTASDVVNTVGKQFAQPIRPRYSDGTPKKDLSKRIDRDRGIDVKETLKNWIDRYLSVQSSDKKHRVIQSDFAEALDGLTGQVTVVYADPPYTRDHYSRYYHVLETLCLRDCPTISSARLNGKDHPSRGIYRTDRYQSPFCIKSKAPEAFHRLFTKVRRLNVPLVLSYSPYERSTGARPRVMSVENIVELARESFRSVEVISAGNIAHSKLNRSDMNKVISYGAEMFIVCKP